ncbi:phenylacetaldoxime dehydratase [Aspergillus steynii IBT 23096]|uniref:Phenylacetaldoxime dehydratase n=1 Tax=Aspergillus steynii IBT 23096 TaxID=1392250 RepID=A0A2I2G761_9EURO|nr:phenylacetaldoxime dehydratase [Aspergillus steynii IBT 23096]PLB48727.1 phenylacetaldoxime dehydratase [Aspergillus steynii IBT 23096]
MTELEPSIPENLRTPRTVPATVPPNHTPPYPLFTSRYPEKVKDLVMAIMGAQYASADSNDGLAMQTISSFTGSDRVPESARPTLQEPAAVVDKSGPYTIAMIVYFPSRQTYDEWAETSGFRAWWTALDPRTQRHGWFLEVFFPSVDRFESILTHPDMHEGSSNIRSAVSKPLIEHGYWGSMRDRLPLSQTDELAGEKGHRSPDGVKRSDTRTARIRVPGRENLAVIRSGQDWRSAKAKERALYLNQLQPALTDGMNFLRDHGAETGCYSNRFMQVTDTAGNGVDRTFGLGYFDELASLEAWSKSHPTHLRIFGGFMKYAKEMGEEMAVRFYHEVLVLTPEQQFFEYVSCWPGTGMLTSLSGRESFNERNP